MNTRFAQVPSFQQAGAQNIEALLRPSSIAVVGASQRRESVGYRVLNSIAGSRYAGALYAVNPGYRNIGTIPCFPSLAELPQRPDLVVLCVRDANIEEAMRSAAELGVPAAVIFGRSYEAEPGDTPLLVRLGAIARESGMAVCGGNCMGFINSIDDLRVSMGAPRYEGRLSGVSLVVHSGSIWEWLIGNQRNLIFDYAVSAGQEIATSCADYMDYLLDQAHTRVLGCVLETVRDSEKFVSVLEKADRKGTPVVILKLGRTERGRAFAQAHTGALTAPGAAYDALFRRHNVVAVDTVEEFLDTIELFRFGKRPGPGGIGVLTQSGGERQLIVDLAESLGAPIADLEASSSDALKEILEPGLTPENPIDAWGDGKLVAHDCLSVLEQDPNVGVVSFAADLFFGPNITYCLEVCERFAAESRKPLVVFGCTHSSIVPQAAERLRFSQIPVLEDTRTAIKAMKVFLDWQAQRERRIRIANATPAVAALPLDEIPQVTGALPAAAAERLLTAAQIPFAQSAYANDQAELIAAAGRVGFPLVLKTANPAIQHKTEHGGVVVGLKDESALLVAYREMAPNCGPSVQIQKMVPQGVEILLGMVHDSQVGPVVTVALGGILTEILKDSVSFLPTLDQHEIHENLRGLKAYPILQGYRSKPGVNIDALCRLIGSFSALCEQAKGRFSEIDLNPVIVSADGAIAVDALFICNPNQS